MSNELVAGLVPAPVDDLAAALRRLAAQLSRQSGISCGFSGRNIAMDGETAAHAYRIAQEAARNALRHGHPRRIRISLSRQANGSNHLRVTDDGTGLKPRLYREGFGISIMRFRAKLIGGELDLRSKPGAGCTVSCVWPAGSAAP
jgi:two-component system CheB/CheR fusion protein